MKTNIYLAVFGLLMTAAPLPAQTTRPVSEDRVEYRASQAFDRGDYAKALPLLRKWVVELKDNPVKAAALQKRIKVCEDALAAAPTTAPAAPSRRAHPAPKPGEVLEMSIKELGNFELNPDQTGGIPDDVKRLNGANIRLTGYMIPADQAEHITQFALDPSLFSCCYGQPPQVQHLIICTCAKGQNVAYEPDQIVVEGKLKVQETRDDGYLTSIFQLEPSHVALAPKEAKK